MADTSPNQFQGLISMLLDPSLMPAGVRGGLNQGTKYGPGGLQALNQFAQGDYMGAAGAAGGTIALDKMLGGVVSKIKNPYFRGAAQIATSLAGATGGQFLAEGAGNIVKKLAGGAEAAGGNLTQAVIGTQREQGQSGISGREVGIGGLSQQEKDQRLAILREIGVTLPNEALNANYQITQKYKDADVGRQMQMNQQLGQLTGALNRQMATYQLAGQAMGETGATTRQILASNPYANSVLQTGGIRGI